MLSTLARDGEVSGPLLWGSAPALACVTRLPERCPADQFLECQLVALPFGRGLGLSIGITQGVYDLDSDTRLAHGKVGQIDLVGGLLDHGLDLAYSVKQAGRPEVG
jgi:hypothetical protein